MFTFPYAGGFRGGVHGRDRHETLHRSRVVHVQLQQMELHQFVLWSGGPRLHSSLVRLLAVLLDFLNVIQRCKR